MTPNLYSPKLHIDADQLDQNQEDVANWNGYATAEVGGAGLPKMRTDEAQRYVRFGTADASHTKGNYLDFGAQSWNLNQGFTAVGMIRFYEEKPIPHWFEFRGGDVEVMRWAKFGANNGTRCRISNNIALDTTNTSPNNVWLFVVVRSPNNSLLENWFDPQTSLSNKFSQSGTIDNYTTRTYTNNWIAHHNGGINSSFACLDVRESIFYDRALSDAELSNVVSYMRAKYANDNPPPYSPKLHIDANHIGRNLLDNASIANWNGYATAEVGGAGLPKLRTDEAHRYVRFGTADASATKGNYLNFGAQTWNLNQGFTSVGMIRFYETKTWQRWFDFGNGANLLNILWSIHGTSVTNSHCRIFNDIQLNLTGSVPSNVWIFVVVRCPSNTLLENWFDPTSALTNKFSASGTITDFSARTLSNNWIGRSNFSVDSYACLDVRESIFYDRALSDAELSNVVSYMRAKYVSIDNIPPYLPKLHIDANQLAHNVLDNTDIATWNGFATAEVGAAGLPKLRTDEAHRYVRFGTADASTTKGNYLDFGTQTWNLNQGFTAVGMIRFYETKDFSRWFEFGDGSNIDMMRFFRSGTTIDTVFRCSSNLELVTTGAAPNDVWLIIVARTPNNTLLENWFDPQTSLTNKHSVSGTINNYNTRVFQTNWIGRPLTNRSYSCLDIRENIFYDRALSDAELQNVVSYMRMKYKGDKLQLSGTLSLSSIIKNFIAPGKPAPDSLQQMYRGASTSANISSRRGIKSNGAISMFDFYGAGWQMQPTNIPGLFAWYTPDSWSADMNRWEDISGNARHTILTRGTIIKGASVDPVGSSIVCLRGNTAAGLRFPTSVLPPNYTLFHVARHTGGALTRARVFDGLGNNWFSGFHGGKTGFAYHSAWLTPTTHSNTGSVHGINWFISCDQKQMYRSAGVQRNVAIPSGSSTHLTINYGASASNESSEWAVAEVIVFDRTLTHLENLQMERYLSVKYGLAPFGHVDIVTENLALYYDPLNSQCYPGSGTTLFDLSGNNRHGTLEGGVFVSTDKVVVLNNSPQYISTTYFPNLDDNRLYTFELWFWDDTPGTTVVGGGTALIGNYGPNSTTPNSRLQIESDGQVTISERNTSSTEVSTSSGATVVCTGQWTHIVRSCTASQQILYINGVQNAQTSRPGGGITSAMSIVIGGHHLSRYQSCRLGPVRIYYDKALTEAEILRNYAAERSELTATHALDALSHASRASVVGTFSVGRMNSGYLGPTVRVRRSSDNATIDFYGDLSGGLLGTQLDAQGTSLSAWLGSTAAAHVVTWYDQSGMFRHVSQATAANQPVLLQHDGRWEIHFNGSMWLSSGDTAFQLQVMSLAVQFTPTGTAPDWIDVVSKIASNTDRSYALWLFNDLRYILWQRYGGVNTGLISTGYDQSTILNRRLRFVGSTGSAHTRMHLDGTLNGEAAAATHFTSSTGLFVIGGSGVIHARYRGYIHACTVFSSQLPQSDISVM